MSFMKVTEMVLFPSCQVITFLLDIDISLKVHATACTVLRGNAHLRYLPVSSSPAPEDRLDVFDAHPIVDLVVVSLGNRSATAAHDHETKSEHASLPRHGSLGQSRHRRLLHLSLDVTWRRQSRS